MRKIILNFEIYTWRSVPIGVSDKTYVDNVKRIDSIELPTYGPLIGETSDLVTGPGTPSELPLSHAITSREISEDFSEANGSSTPL